MNEQNVINFGSGIVLFKNAVDFDFESIKPYLEDAEDRARRENFTLVYDENGQLLHGINQGGFIYEIEMMNRAPLRLQQLHESVSLLFENALYAHLMPYIEMYPALLQCLWWRINGHALSYSTTGSLGLHADNDVNYRYGFFPKEEHATRVVVSAIAFLNSSVQSIEELTEDTYCGGEMHFEYAGVTISPQKGDLLFFPANYVGAHEVMPVHGGKRYSYLVGYAQGSAQPEKAINPQVQSSGSGGQEWLTTLIEDYQNHLVRKYGQNIPDKLQTHVTRPQDHQYN